MIGKLLSTAIKVATIPIDSIDAALGALSGGDGSKESIDQADIPRPSAIRDAVCDRVEEIDK